MNESRYSVSRREFLAASGAAASALAVQPAELLMAAEGAEKPWVFEPVKIPAWVRKVTRMAFVTPGEVEKAAELGVQVCHGNAVWPYFPLRRDGGGLSEADRKLMQRIIDTSHKHGMKYCLGLPPFPSVSHMLAHPDWRVHPEDSDAATKIEPREDNLGTRLGCNNGPWGDYLIDICVEMMKEFGIDGYSFDGNCHAPIRIFDLEVQPHRCVGQRSKVGIPRPYDRSLQIVAVHFLAICQPKAGLRLTVGVLNLDSHRTGGGGRGVERQLIASERERPGNQFAADEWCVQRDEAVDSQAVLIADLVSTRPQF